MMKEVKPKMLVRDNLDGMTDQCYHLSYIFVSKGLQRRGLATQELHRRMMRAQKQGAIFFSFRGLTNSGKRLINRLEKIGIIIKT